MPSDSRRSLDYLLVTPLRDDADLVDDLIACVVAQDLKPRRWLIVDDQSRDATALRVARAAEHYPWIRLQQLRAPLTPGLLHYAQLATVAFNRVRELAEEEAIDYSYVANLDADVRPGPQVLAELVARGERDRGLGILSTRLVEHTSRGGLRTLAPSLCGAPPAGLRLWRRSCLDDVALSPSVHWAAVTTLRARNRGYATLMCEDLVAEVVRASGSRAGAWSSACAAGAGMYCVGLHPALTVGEAMRRASLTERMGVMVGYAAAKARAMPRSREVEVTRYFGQELLAERMARLRGRLRGSLHRALHP